MTDNNSNTEQQSSNIGVWTFERFICDLWHNQPDKSDQLLHSTGNAFDMAQNMASGLASTLMGLGCLVSSDEREDGRCSSGNFTNTREVKELIWSVSNQLDIIAGLMLIGDDASFTLKEREIEALRKNGKD